MQFYVTGSDGNEYGPVDMATLVAWANEHRIIPTSMLRDAVSGQRMPASAVPGLFPASPPTQTVQVPPSASGAQAPGGQPYGQNFSQPAQPSVPYPRPGGSASPDDAFPWRAFIYPFLALASFFVCGGFGFIFGGYGVYYAVQVHQSGSKYGVGALVWSILCLLAVLSGYALHMRAFVTR